MVFEEAVVAASKAEGRTKSTWKYTMWASCQSNGIEAMWHMESRLRVPVQMESRLSVPVQDGVQTLKSTGIAIDTRGTWSIPREETTWIDSVLLRRTQLFSYYVVILCRSHGDIKHRHKLCFAEAWPRRYVNTVADTSLRQTFGFGRI